jgi:predicted dehydrogenase
MITVGVIGLGMMGLTHLDVYARRDDVEVIAIADCSAERLSGSVRAAGNVPGQAQGSFDASRVRRYPDATELIADPDIDLVDICLPTHAHFESAVAALNAGKHLFIEKPLARTAKDAMALAKTAQTSKGLAMCGMCMRFWPGWTWLKEAIEQQTFGRVKSASFRRLASHPGGPIYSSGELSGGAILDLHIHDTDFIQYCFGPPRAVLSRGYSTITSAIDHVVTQYHYDDVPLVMAEGSWCMASGFGFNMQFIVNFERATAMYDLASNPLLKLVREGKAEPVQIPPGMGYEYEICYFLDCIKHNRQPQVVTLADAARSVAIVEAEARSIATGQPVVMQTTD